MRLQYLLNKNPLLTKITLPLLLGCGSLLFLGLNSCSAEQSQDPKIIEPTKRTSDDIKKNLEAGPKTSTTPNVPINVTASPSSTATPVAEGTTSPSITPVPSPTNNPGGAPNKDEARTAVQNLLEKYCATCHSTSGMASYAPLSTVEETLAVKEKVMARVMSSDMPMPPSWSEEGKSLTEAERTAFVNGLQALTQ